MKNDGNAHFQFSVLGFPVLQLRAKPLLGFGSAFWFWGLVSGCAGHRETDKAGSFWCQLSPGSGNRDLAATDALLVADRH